MPLKQRLMQLWDRLFLEQRPSLSMGFFRIALAAAVGLHTIPTLMHMPENYLSTAFKEKNVHFFTRWILELVEKSPDGLVWAMAILFYVFWFCFFIGLFSRISCILMVGTMYYFYALNSLHIGTLSFDILLVTLFLMCITNYHGDYFSIDCLIRPNAFAHRRTRPFFLQRLLQLQIATTFFYTGLVKCTAEGNWLTENPFYYLVNGPPTGIMKDFPLRDFFAGHAGVCYAMGIALIVFEFSMPALLFIRRTRWLGVGLGCAFQTMLVITLHVPTVFFFHFIPQFMLFFNPKKIVAKIDAIRLQNRKEGRIPLVYDGNCSFCRGAIRRLLTMDMLGVVRKVNYQNTSGIWTLHKDLNYQKCQGQLHLVEGDRLYAGFGAFRRLSLLLPMLWPLAPILYIPGMGIPGALAYALIAKNRYLLHRSARCKDNACFHRREVG